MDITIKAKLLTAESKPYSVNGNEGVSHKVRLLVGNEIFVCKSSKEQVARLQDVRGTDGEATFRLTSRKELLALELVSFES